MSKWPKNKVRFKKDTYPGQRWNLGDFILWHGYRDGDRVFWDTKIGKGRPAWNIQDPAMISTALGYSLDIFCGGIDNMCRHHDYNIAVMESVSGEELARLLHGEHVLVNGRKMSKSLDNEVYPEDLIARGFSWQHIRFYLLHRPYRKKLNLTLKSFQQVSEKLDAFRSMSKAIVGRTQEAESNREESAKALIRELKLLFENGMNDNLNTWAAFEGVSKTVSSLHKLKKDGRLLPHDAAEVEQQLRRMRPGSAGDLGLNGACERGAAKPAVRLSHSIDDFTGPIDGNRRTQNCQQGGVVRLGSGELPVLPG